MCNRTKIRLKENVKVTVNVTVYTRYADGTVDVYQDHNTTTDDYKDLLRDIASGVETDGQIKYLAWYTTATESGRKQITRVADGATGIVTLTTIITTIEANDTVIDGFRLYAGDEATITADSGVKAAEVAWTPAHTKNQLESIQVDWQLTFA